MLNRTFSALKYRNFRLFFYGQFISLIGTWMQGTALSWLIYDLTKSKALLGIIGACSTLPMLLFSVFGGMIADRRSKRNILFFTQTLLMISAFVLGTLVFLDIVQVWHIALIAFVSGVGVALDMPTRQAFVTEMVGQEDRMNAISLNSSIFNAARVVGPAIAGILMAKINLGFCFILNGLSFVAVLYGLKLMKVEPSSNEFKKSKSFWGDFSELAIYVFHKKEIFWFLVAVSMIAVFGWSFQTLTPAFAQDILHIEEKGYGFLLTAGGIGALLAALSLATLNNPKVVLKISILGIFIFSVSTGIFSWSTHYFLSLTSFAIGCFGITAFFTSGNTFVQLSVPDEIRGRMMGIWTLVFGGMMPIGNLLVGFLGETIGPEWTVSMGAMVCFLTVLALPFYFYKANRS